MVGIYNKQGQFHYIRIFKFNGKRLVIFNQVGEIIKQSEVDSKYLNKQIDQWRNRLNIFDGFNDQSMKIGEFFGNSNNRLVKTISSSGGEMFIDFKKESYWGTVSFFANIKYKKIDFDCQTWLDLEENVLRSPENFKHGNNINCSWFITKSFGNYIYLYFNFIEVIINY